MHPLQQTHVKNIRPSTILFETRQGGAFQGGILKPSKKRYKNLRKILQKSLPTGLFFITVLPFFGLLLLLLA